MSHVRMPFVALAALMASAALSPAADPTLPADLAIVPPDAIGFVHVRVADLYQSENFRDLRQLIGKAGADAINAFNSRFVPSPASVDRVTAFALPPAEGANEPEPIIVIATSTPFDTKRLIKSVMPGTSKDEGQNIYSDEHGATAIFVPNTKMIVVGSPAAIRRLAKATPGATGALSPLLATAAANKPVVIGINSSLIPPDAFQSAPRELRPYLPILRAKLITLVMDFEKGTHIDLRLKYADARAAADADQAARAGIVMGRQFLAQGRAEMEKKLTAPNLPNPAPIEQLPDAAGALLGLAGINTVDEVLRNPPLKLDGNDLRVDVTLPPGPVTMAAAGSAVSAGLLLPAVQKVREAAARTQAQNNLKQIGLALHNYESVYGRLPTYAIYSKDGKTPLLSWRVAILPFIEQEQLYRRFKLDEPWDSEHNKQLIPLMPKIYLIPNARPTNDSGTTYCQAFVGKGAGWEKGPTPNRILDFTDGTSNTIVVAEAADPVVWTKPDDLFVEQDKPLPKLGGHFPGGFNALFMDGSVRFIRSTINEKTLRALITRNGGEVINFDF